MCFFKVKHRFGHISGMVGPIDVKVKRKGSASVGYWVQYVTLTFDLTQVMTLTLYVSRSNFEIALLRSCWSDCCEMKTK